MYVLKKTASNKLKAERRVDNIMVSLYFGQAYETFISVFEKSMRPWELGPNQCMTLWLLQFLDQPLTASVISRMLMLESHSVTFVLDRLQKRRFIKRKHSKTDRRVIEVTLTDEGKKIIEEISPPFRELIDTIFLKTFTDTELTILGNLMQKIRDAGIAWQGADPEKAKFMAAQFERGVQRQLDTTKTA